LTCINKNSLLQSNIKTAYELSEEHKRFKKTNEYKEKLENYKKDIIKEYKSLVNSNDVASYLRKIELKETYDLINSNHATSPPDFVINNFPTADLDKMVAKMEYMLDNQDFTSKEEEYFNKAIDQIKTMREIAIERQQEVVSFAVEVITISYSMEAIREKEIYAQITNTEVIYIYEGGE
jgi:hypothetical protein